MNPSPYSFPTLRRWVLDGTPVDQPAPEDPFVRLCREMIDDIGPREAFRRLSLSGLYQPGYAALVANLPVPRRSAR